MEFSTFGGTRDYLFVSSDHCFRRVSLSKLSGKSLSLVDYSEAALDSATFIRQLGSLEWWKNSGLPLKIGYVVSSLPVSFSIYEDISTQQSPLLLAARFRINGRLDRLSRLVGKLWSPRSVLESGPLLPLEEWQHPPPRLVETIALHSSLRQRSLDQRNAIRSNQSIGLVVVEWIRYRVQVL